MGSKKKSGSGAMALPGELVAQRVAFASSGAAGTHADQTMRVHRVGVSHRVGSRSARKRAAVNDGGW